MLLHTQAAPREPQTGAREQGGRVGRVARKVEEDAVPASAHDSCGCVGAAQSQQRGERLPLGMRSSSLGARTVDSAAPVARTVDSVALSALAASASFRRWKRAAFQRLWSSGATGTPPQLVGQRPQVRDQDGADGIVADRLPGASCGRISCDRIDVDRGIDAEYRHIVCLAYPTGAKKIGAAAADGVEYANPVLLLLLDGALVGRAVVGRSTCGRGV